MTENTRATLVEAFCVVFGREPDKVHEAEWKAWLAKFARFRRLLDVEAWTDAAMMLVPEGWRVQLSDWDHDDLRAHGAWQAILTPPGKRGTFDEWWPRCDHAETPAHALLAACLKAKEQADG